MSTDKQRAAAERHVKQAQPGANAKQSLANLPKATKAALVKQRAAVAKRKRTRGTSPKSRAEPYEIAKQRGLPALRRGESRPCHVLDSN